jgi:photosystem II stability/assembly factor-like uncharacterized protein
MYVHVQAAVAVASSAVLALAGGGCAGANRSAARHAHIRTTISAGATAPRFQPGSFTAISDGDYWLLGTVRCGGRRCASILRTTNGGRSFTRVGAPPLPTQGSVPTLRFADRHDGFAFVPGVGGVFYATHDGGATWNKLPLRTVLAFATAGGTAYAVTARCSRVRCSSYRFERSPVSANSWRPRGLPFVPDGSILDLAAHGSQVWLLGTPRAIRPGQGDDLAHSRDGGTTFVTRRGPCSPGLGGDLEPSSATVVWAVCPTGMLAGAWRSTNGGATFANLKTPTLPNSAMLAPASAGAAVLARNGARSPLLRTTDAGRTWKRVSAPPAAYTIWIGFTDARAGAAIVETVYDASKAQRQVLWRTTDGGAHWHAVRLG